ncbi:MAG TPA: C25 family peptidase propeptide domain-containing protein, partial [Bacteroidales bacterium]
MKLFIHHCRLFAVLFAILLTLSLQAGNDIVLKKDKTSKLVISEGSYQHLKLENTLSALQYFDVKTTKGEFAKLQAGEYAGSDIYGSPQLPVLRKLFEIPVSAKPIVKVISYTVMEYKLSDFGINLPLFPAQPPVSKSQSNPEFVYNAKAYQQNSFTGNDLATVDELGILRGTRLGRLNISPVQYNPVTNSIRIYDNLVIDINFTGADVSRTKAEKRRYDSPYFRTVYDRLINYKQTDNLLDKITKYP